MSEITQDNRFAVLAGKPEMTDEEVFALLLVRADGLEEQGDLATAALLRNNIAEIRDMKRRWRETEGGAGE